MGRPPVAFGISERREKTKKRREFCKHQRPCVLTLKGSSRFSLCHRHVRLFRGTKICAHFAWKSDFDAITLKLGLGWTPSFLISCLRIIISGNDECAFQTSVCSQLCHYVMFPCLVPSAVFSCWIAGMTCFSAVRSHFALKWLQDSCLFREGRRLWIYANGCLLLSKGIERLSHFWNITQTAVFLFSFFLSSSFWLSALGFDMRRNGGSWREISDRSLPPTHKRKKWQLEWRWKSE